MNAYRDTWNWVPATLSPGKNPGTHWLGGWEVIRAGLDETNNLPLTGFRWTSSPGHFIPGEELRYPLNRRLGGPQSRAGRCGVETNNLPLTGFRWTSSPDHFIPGKEPRYPLNRRLGGPQSRAGRCGVETNILPLTEFRNPDRLSHSLGAILITLFRLPVSFQIFCKNRSLVWDIDSVV